MLDDHALLDQAEGQHGLITRAQAAQLGFDCQALRRRLQRSLLRELTPRVLAISGMEMTGLRLAMAATLDAGDSAVVSHQSAAALWKLPGFEIHPPHVLVTRTIRNHAAELGPVHSTTLMLEHHRVRLDAIPVTTPTRLAFDLSGRVSYDRLERTIENMWSRRLTSGPKLFRMLDELSEHGRPRIRHIRSYLEPRGGDYRPAESALELRVQKLIVEDGQPPLVQQHRAGDETEPIGRIDLSDPPLRFLLEVQSDLYHTSFLDRELDRLRIARLQKAGFIVREVREFDVWHAPAIVTRIVREGRAAARSRIAQSRDAA